MTVQNAIERIRRIFPKAGIQEIVKELDIAQEEFVDETQTLFETVTLSSPSSNVVWSLPSDFNEVDRLDFYNSSDNPLYVGDDIYIDWDVEDDKIFFRGSDSTNITGLPSSVSTAYLRYFKKPDSIGGESGTFTVNSRYHEGIVARVISKLMHFYPTLQLEGGTAIDFRSVSSWNSVWEKYLRKARSDKKSGYSDEPMTVQNYQFAGDFYKQKRVKDLSGGSVSGTLVGFSKYVKLTAISPSTLTVGTPIGFSGVSAAMNSGTIEVTSSASFSANTFVHPNQNINYSYQSSSQIDLYPNSNWGTLVVEFYER